MNETKTKRLIARSLEYLKEFFICLAIFLLGYLAPLIEVPDLFKQMMHSIKLFMAGYAFGRMIVSQYYYWVDTNKIIQG